MGMYRDSANVHVMKMYRKARAYVWNIHEWPTLPSLGNARRKAMELMTVYQRTRRNDPGSSDRM
jgi:hypothetical protein